MQFHDYPRQLEEYYVQRLRETYRGRQERLLRIKAPDQAKNYVARVRRKLRQVFGPLPPRTPLNARTTRVSDFGEYQVEHLLYESRPGFLVSANLYLPRGLTGRAPAVLFVCGHSENGKAHSAYVKGCVRLVREGYVVLCFDPVAQGERDLYTAVDTSGRLVRSAPCDEHNVTGRQLHAWGEWLGTWRLWDGIRSLDYLLSRPEVGVSHVGVTGSSGGGTMSAYLWAMDRRFTMVASSCWATSYLLDLENSLPADEEQCGPGLLAAGLDKIDYFMARAGDPTLLLGQERDFFDDRGLRQGYQELLRVHKLMGGKPGTCRLVIDTGEHSYSDANQLQMLDFFNRCVGKPKSAADRPIEVPTEEQLQATPTRDVHGAGSRPIYDLVAEQAKRVAGARQSPRPDDLASVICRSLAIRVPTRAPHHRRFHQWKLRQQRASTGQQMHRFAVESEPGILCTLRHVCREGSPYRLEPGAHTVLYLPNIDSQEELSRPETMAGEADFWTLDVRGQGEGLFRPHDPFDLYGVDWMLSVHAIMYGGSMLGARVFDVLSAVRLLRAEGAQKIHLVGRKQGAVLALIAGALDPDIATVSSYDAPESFLALATAPYTFWPLATFPHGVLKCFDLPEVRRALDRRLVHDTRSRPDEFAA